MQISDYIPSVGDDASVAAKAGLDRTTVSRIRRGVIDPPLSTVAKIVGATGGRIVIEACPVADGKQAVSA